ncbi:MAG: 50S ribosomal protein L24 [Patescibacteria group bacterium]|nr:50S ribosomal protein L24 [Patescibacteria group bacterium]
MKIKKGDTVLVVAGKDKGKKGEVTQSFPQENRVIIEGINMVKKHVKPSEGQKGGIVSKEASIHVSNVMFLENDTPVRLGYRTEKGQKVRFSKKSGKSLAS